MHCGLSSHITSRGLRQMSGWAGPDIAQRHAAAPAAHLERSQDDHGPDTHHVGIDVEMHFQVEFEGINSLQLILTAAF